jgi:hypothetical protein
MVDVGFGAKKEADPAAVRQNVMRLGLSATHKLIADRLRKGDIEQAIRWICPSSLFPNRNAVPPNLWGARVISPQELTAAVIRFLAFRTDITGSRFTVLGSPFTVDLQQAARLWILNWLPPTRSPNGELRTANGELRTPTWLGR